VNNAGIFLAKRRLTVDGIECTLAVNHLAPFLLTNLFLDGLKESATDSGNARIITTSSIAHKSERIDFDDIQFKKRRYNGVRAYAQSKLANILFTYELARRLEGTGVIANCFHPGGVRTNLAQGNPWIYRLIWTIVSPFLLSPEKGADTAIYLASTREVDGMHGKYLVKRKPVKSSGLSYDMEAAGKLWKLSEELTSL
jgi:NAD(P)-dependent dehydrogenase (short-subunit alcohol dehydrogenase family)